MSDKNNLLYQLSKLLKWKESKAFMAKKLNISLEELNELLVELRSSNTPTQIVRVESSKPQTYTAPNWIIPQTSFTKKEEKELIQRAFFEFLQTFKPKQQVVLKAVNDVTDSNTCLVLNIQDAHYNKHDINGQNNIQQRFKAVKNKIKAVLDQSSTISNLYKVVYVIGSDMFNSEWTDETTKGTPQLNVLSYQESFKAIAQHEIDVLELLAEYVDNIEIMYCPGNHDEYVGWHLMHWLQSYFRNQTNITFDISPKYTKYIKFYNTAMCFNHGDGAKPEVIAKTFPFAFKDQWSKCEHFIIFGGDKHTELSRDLGGIKFYRIPSLSNAQSKWDSKNGYGAKAELTGFLIHESGDMDIIKRPI